MNTTPVCQRIVMLVLALSFASVTLYAAPISLSIINPNRIGAAGDVITFDGTITNNTGIALDSTDLFLEPSAGNLHAGFCGSRRRATASGHPVGSRHLLSLP